MAHPFSDLNLARRLERAEGHANAMCIEARARISPAVGAAWIEVAGAYAMFDGALSPITQTFGLGLFESADEGVLERIEGFFQDRGAPAIHEVSPLAGLATTALLHRRSYRPIEFTSVMVRPVELAGDAFQVNPKIHVRMTREGEGDVWAAAAAEGWGHLPGAAEYLLEFAPVAAATKDRLAYLAEIDGRPIAAASLCLHGGVALMGGACTIPEARRQGAQLALLQGRLRDAEERGCDLAMICAEPGSASQRNAERHGFRIAYTRIKWELGQETLP